MPTSTLRLPPRTAKNYDAQIIHRFYSIAEQIEQPVDRWVTDANWSVQLAINEAEGRGETIETLDLPSLNTEPLPPIIVEFRQLMRAVLLESSSSTQLAILEKLIDTPFHTSVFFDRYLTVTGVGDVLLSLYSRPTSDETQFQVKLKAASALAKLSSAIERLDATDQFLKAIGVDKFWQDLPRLFMDDLLPACVQPADQAECIRLHNMSFRGLADKKPHDRDTVHSFYTLYKQLIEDPKTPTETLDTLCKGLAETLDVAQYDASWFHFIADVFHQVDPYSTLIDLIRKDLELGTLTEQGCAAEMAIQYVLADEDEDAINDQPPDDYKAVSDPSIRCKAFIEAGGASIARKRFVKMINRDMYQSYNTIMMRVCGEADWASAFELDDVERFAAALYQDDVKPELLRTFRAFLSHPEALKRCQNMRFYRPVMNELHEDRTFAMAALTMVTLFVGDEPPEDLYQEWLTILGRVICANIRVAYENDLARMVVISILTVLITMDKAQAVTLRQLKFEPLLIFWTLDTDQPEAIKCMAAALALKLRDDDLKVEVELVENGLRYLDQFEQKPIPLPETQDEATDQPDGDATKGKKSRSERPIKETTRDIVAAMQKRGLLQCNTFGFQLREGEDPDSSLPDLFKEYFEYCREKSGQVYAAGVPLIAAFVSAEYANPDELKALEPGICNVVIQGTIGDMPHPPKIRWTKAEKKGHYHQHVSLIDPKPTEEPNGSPQGSVVDDDGGPANTTEVPSDKGDDEDDANEDDDVDQEDDNNSYVIPSDSDESVGDMDEFDGLEDQGLDEAERTGADDGKETSDEVVVDHDSDIEIEATEEQDDISVPSEVQSVAETPKDRTCHENASCDGCGAEPIKGPRYKCKQCANYDLCTDCHDTASYIHPEHTWHPVELYGDYDEEQGIAQYLTDEDKTVKLGAHPGIECDQCKRSPIYGIRSQCGACDANYCSACIDDRKITCKENGGQCFYFMTSGPPQQEEKTQGHDEEEREDEPEDEPEDDNEPDPAPSSSDAEEEVEDAVGEEDEEEYQYPDEIVALARTVTAMLWALKYNSGDEEDAK